MRNIRLYVAPGYATYNEEARSDNMNTVLNKMDYFILEKELTAKYLVVAEINYGDTPIFLGYGDKDQYLRFREKYYDREVCKTYKKKK